MGRMRILNGLERTTNFLGRCSKTQVCRLRHLRGIFCHALSASEADGMFYLAASLFTSGARGSYAMSSLEESS